MRKILFWLLLLPSILTAFDYEIVEKTDRIQIQSLSFALEHHSETVRILSEEGTEYRKSIAVNAYIKVKNIHGSVRFPDGRTNAIRDEDIAELPISESALMISDLKAIVIAPADLTEGTTVTIEYDREVTSLLYVDSFVFATAVPVMKATCNLIYPSHIPIKYRGVDQNVQVQKLTDAGRTTLLFQTGRQEAIRLIGANASSESFEKRVEFVPEQCTTDKWILKTSTWQNIALWFSDLSKFASQIDPAMEAVVSEVTVKHKTPEAVAAALYQYIQNNFVYTAIEVGIGGFKPRFAPQTFLKKYGDCKDLTFLYLALLRKAGIEAYPALVDARTARSFNQDFPSPRQFNHCIAYLPNVGKGTWVDTTVKNFRLGEIPSMLQGKLALVSGGPNQLLKIPEDLPEANVFQMKATGKVSRQQLEIQGNIETAGLQSAVVDLMQNALLRTTVKHYVYSKIFLPDLPLLNVKSDMQSSRTLGFQYSTALSNLDPYQTLLVNPLNYRILEKLSYSHEPGDYFLLGLPLRILMEASFDLAGHQMISAPYRIDTKGKHMSFKAELSEKNGVLHYSADAFFLNGFLSAPELSEYQKELREFSTSLQRVVVLR